MMNRGNGSIPRVRLTPLPHGDEVTPLPNGVYRAIGKVATSLIQPVRGEQIVESILKTAIEISRSKFGYIGIINRKSLSLDIVAWQGSKEIGFLKSDDSSFPSISSEKDIWGWVVDRKDGVFVNKKSSYKFSRIPEKVIVERYLSVPSVFEGEVIGQVSVANSAANYTLEDLQAIQQLADLFSLALHRLDIESELKSVKDGLERRVEERTKELVKLNTKLEEEIAERRSVEHALMLSEQRYRSIIENAPYGLFIASSGEGRFLYVNEKLSEMLCESKDALLKKSVTDFLEQGGSRESLQRLLKQGTENGEVFQKNTRCIVAGEKSDAILCRLSMTPTEHAGIRAWQGVMLDITQEVAFEKQIRHTQKMEELGTLAAGIAHEFNNLLTVILGHAQLVRANATLDREMAEGLDEIVDAARQAASLSKKMRTLTHLRTGEQKPLHIGHLIEGVCELIEADLPEGVEIKGDIERNLPSIRGDASQIEQIVFSLVENSIDAMPDGGEIEVGVHRKEFSANFCQNNLWTQPGVYVEVRIADSGKGMSPLVLEHIFDPFFTTKPPGQGSGLGMAVAYSIAKSHGGTLYAESDVNIGTRVYLLLPAIDETAKKVAEDLVRLSWAPSSGESILVVDDDALVREVLRQVLSSVGYSVEVAPDGDEAVRRFKHARRKGSPFDLVILDIVMPRTDGWRCREEIIEIEPEARIVMMSGRSEALQNSRKYTERVLAKPFETEDLFEEVRRALKVEMRRGKKV